MDGQPSEKRMNSIVPTAYTKFTWVPGENTRMVIRLVMLLAKELVTYVKEMGFTHVELMPVMEHP